MLAGVQTQWVVLTGPPSAGKSKLLEYLATMGYHTVPEIARVVLDDAASVGLDARSDQTGFDQSILDRKIVLEERLNPEELIFLDRGLPESEVYANHFGVKLVGVMEAMAKRRYDKVLFAESRYFVSDSARIETPEESVQLGSKILAGYKLLGYDPIMIPWVSPISKRAEFMLDILGLPVVYSKGQSSVR